MTVSEARQAMQQAFFTAWGSTSNIAWDNDNYTHNYDGTTATKPYYVRFLVSHNIGEQVALGNTGGRLFRKYGIVIVNIYVQQNVGVGSAANTGELSLDELTENALNIFYSQAGNVRFTNQRVSAVGVVDEGYYRQDVLADFDYDTIK